MMAQTQLVDLLSIVGLVYIFMMGVIHIANARSTGAPLEACTDLTPSGHSAAAQTGASPYLISVPSYYISEQPFTGDTIAVVTPSRKVVP